MSNSNSSTYDNPEEITGMNWSFGLRGPSGQSSPSNASTTGQFLAPDPLLRRRRRAAGGPHDEREKLERSNRRLTIIFRLLVTLSFFAVVIYLGLIVALVVGSSTSPRTETSPRTDPSLMPPAEVMNCVPEEEFKSFRNIWDSQEFRDVQEMLESVGLDYEYKSKKEYRSKGEYRSKKEYCFKSLKWVPRVISMIYCRVETSLNIIEDQQENINETVKSFISVNNKSNQCADAGIDKEEPDDFWDPRNSVYAHYYLDTTVSYKSGQQTLQWVKEGQKLSTRKYVDVSGQRGLFTIRQTGVYFLYTHVVFKDDGSQNIHSVLKTGRDNSYKSKLLEATRSGVSYMQGIFRLRKNESLQVQATADKLDSSREMMSYFGMYLIRA